MYIRTGTFRAPFYCSTCEGWGVTEVTAIDESHDDARCPVCGSNIDLIDPWSSKHRSDPSQKWLRDLLLPLKPTQNWSETFGIR